MGEVFSCAVRGLWEVATHTGYGADGGRFFLHGARPFGCSGPTGRDTAEDRFFLAGNRALKVATPETGGGRGQLIPAFFQAYESSDHWAERLAQLASSCQVSGL